MIDCKLNIQNQFRLLVMLTSFSSALTINVWTVSLDSEKTLKYTVLVKRQWPTHYMTQPGLLLNDHYVFTNYGTIFRKTPFLTKNYTVMTGYYGKMEFDMKGEEYSIGSIHLYRSMVLLRVVGIKFGPTVGCIKLPSESTADLWKHPTLLPNNVDVLSSCWGYDKIDFRILQVRRGKRNCDDKIISKTPKHLIPSCLVRDETIPFNDCYADEGIALVYNNTLMGIKAYYSNNPPKEYNTSSKYDLFHNVAFYVDWLQDVMIHYSPCEAA